MKKEVALNLRCLMGVCALAALLVLAGCAGVSSAKNSVPPPGAGQLSVSPASMNFGNVNVGSNTSQQGSLTAGSNSITVSSAAWNGSGYALSGITLPVQVPAGQSIPFTVTFTPASAGTATGSVSFTSNASNSPGGLSLTGNGVGSSGHTVGLTWNPSASSVIGYNVYRGLANGGPYAKINTTLQASTNYTDGAVQSGKTYYYVTTAVDSGGLESAYSNQAQAAIP